MWTRLKFYVWKELTPQNSTSSTMRELPIENIVKEKIHVFGINKLLSAKFQLSI